MKRTLTVRKEVLAELTSDELADVFAGTQHPVTMTGCTPCTTIPTIRCD